MPASTSPLSTVPLHSQVTGSGERTVILIHGLFGMSDNLGVLAKALESDYCVHRLDLRNHGRSGRSGSMTLAEMAADVREYIAQQQLDCFAIVGHSLGGKVSMQLALDNQPGLCGTVIADIAPVTYQAHHGAVLAGLNGVDLTQVNNRAEADRQLAEHLPEATLRQFLLKNLYRNEQKQFDWRINLPVITECYLDVLQAPSGDRSSLPTLFIKGENSDYITAEHRGAIERHFPAFQFKMIADTGHWLHAEKPDMFNRLVQRFLANEITWS